MSVNEKMTAIADAIRAKTGDTGLLTLDLMASAIANLSTSGGGGDDDFKITSGEYLCTSSNAGVNIEHGLGELPKTILFFRKDSHVAQVGLTSAPSSYYAIFLNITCQYLLENGEIEGYKYINVYASCSSLGYYTSTSSGSTRKYMEKINVTVNESIDSIAESATTYCARNITDTSFLIPQGTRNGKTYGWIAMNRHLL